ncbi:RidA family protein [Kibdelosporangium philippinense]|uniref:RidA family protein n=1 Tax=Kibdelosporangium philippinense TaxID=211113 RepID=UPI00361BF308
MLTFSPSRRVGNLVFVSGQIAPAAGGDICEQTTEVLRLIEEQLATHEASLQDVVDITAFVKDPRWCVDVLEVARPFFQRTRQRGRSLDSPAPQDRPMPW